MTLGHDPSESYARARDAADPLAPLRAEFAFPSGEDGRPLVYLCGNSLGLMPRRVPDLMRRELEDWARYAVEGHHLAAVPWYSYHDNLRDSTARLVGARPDEVVVMNSLTVNLHLMLVSFYRPEGARTKLVIEESAFPSDRYAVFSHLAARGVDPAENVIVLAPAPGEHLIRTEAVERLLAERGAEIALVMLPGVQYYTGQWFDLARITAAAHAAGALAGFDLAHAAGNVPLSLHDWDVDFAAWCSYKYLNGGPGAAGGCFIHQRHGADPDVPRFAGWWGNDPDTRFRMHLNADFVPRRGADGWQLSNPPVFAMTPLLASLDQLDRVGMAALRVKSVELTGYLESLLSVIPADRLTPLTPSDPDARGCQLSLLLAGDGKAVFDAVRARGVLADFRQPDVIRMAPVPLYNSFHDVWRAATALIEALDD